MHWRVSVTIFCMTDVETARNYFKGLGQLSRGEKKADVRDLIAGEKNSELYSSARKTLVDLRDSKKTSTDSSSELSPDQEFQKRSIEMGYSIFNKYSDLRASIEEKQKHGKQEGIGKDRAQLKNLLHTTAQAVMAEPELIEPMFSVWKSQPMEDGKKEIAQDLYTETKSSMGELIKKHPEKVTEKQIQKWLELYTHNMLISDMGSGALTEYFRAQTSGRQRVDAAFLFATSALHMNFDRETLGKVQEILRFETSIIPVQSDYFFDINARAVRGIDDDSALVKAIFIDSMLVNISTLIESPGNETRSITEMFDRHRSYWGEEKSAVKLHTAWESFYKNAVKKFGQKNADDRLRQLKEFHEYNDVQKASGAPQEVHETNYVSRLMQDSLVSEVELLRDKFAARSIMSRGQNHFLKDNPGSYTSLNFQVQNGKISVSILAEEGLSREKIMHQISNQMSGVSPDDYLVQSMASSRSQIDDKNLFVMYYKPLSEMEGIHPASVIGEIGLPRPQLEGKSIAETNAETAREIQIQKRRYLDKRGVKIPLDLTPQLKELGYKSLQFKADSDNPKKTIVNIDIAGLQYSLKLDGNFNLDFEGKTFPDGISDELQYMLLAFLKPVLCEDLESPEGAKISPETFKILARKAHIRCLSVKEDGTPLKSSPQQAKLLLNERGEDLAVINLEKQLYGDCRESRGFHNHTYVKAVEKEGSEGLDSQEIIIQPELHYPDLVTH